MNAWRSVCGPISLAMPARRATRRTMRAAPCRSRRLPSLVVKIGPAQRSPTGQVDGAGGAWREGDSHGLAALAQHRQSPMAPFDAEGFDVDPDRLGDPKGR